MFEFEISLETGALIVGALFLVWLIRWINTPYEYLKNLTDIGYGHIRGLKPTRKDKDIEIERIRRTRRSGKRLPPPFPNGWYMVTESMFLKKGDVLSVDIIGQNFVVFRTESGEAVVFDAYCPHLGANLGVGGKVKGDCIECPFHEWRFRASDGECSYTPYTTDENLPKKAKLKKWITCEVNEAVFVWYHVEGDAPWRLPSIPQVDSGKWLYSGKSEFFINGHIQQVPENAADVGHLNAIHSPNMFTGSDLRFTRPKWSMFATHTWHLTYEPSTEPGEQHIAHMRLRHSMMLFNCWEILTMYITVRQIGPGYVTLHLKSFLAEFQILQTVVPVEPLMQRVLHRFYFPTGMSLFAKFIIWGESIMFERDIAVWNNQQFIDNPLLLKEEKSIRAFRNWFGQFYSANSKTIAQLNDEKLEW